MININTNSANRSERVKNDSCNKVCKQNEIEKAGTCEGCEERVLCEQSFFNKGCSLNTHSER